MGAGRRAPWLSPWAPPSGQITAGTSSAPPLWGANLPVLRMRRALLPLSLADRHPPLPRASFHGRQRHLIFSIKLSQDVLRVNKFRTLWDSEQLVISKQLYTWSSGQSLPRAETSRVWASEQLHPVCWAGPSHPPKLPLPPVSRVEPQTLGSPLGVSKPRFSKCLP